MAQTGRIMDNAGKLVLLLNYEAQRSRSGDGAHHFNLLNHNSRTSTSGFPSSAAPAQLLLLWRWLVADGRP